MCFQLFRIATYTKNELTNFARMTLSRHQASIRNREKNKLLQIVPILCYCKLFIISFRVGLSLMKLQDKLPEYLPMVATSLNVHNSKVGQQSKEL